jgi:four helix bundle protein
VISGEGLELSVVMEQKIKNYRDLIVWQKSMDLVEQIYVLSSDFPTTETYGLTSQIKRAAVSVPSNIAEGSSKKSTKEYIRFLNISYGSLAEIETQILIASRLKFITEDAKDSVLDKTTEIAKILSWLINSLKRRLEEGPKLSTLTTNN